MPNIQIERPHKLGVDQAKKAVDKVAEAITQKFAVTSSWDKNTLRFSRSGVQGTIAVDKDTVTVSAELGFMLGFMKTRIEDEINAHLDKTLV